VSPIELSLTAFAAIVGGVLVGVFLRRALPGHHLADEAKDDVRLGTGLIATIAALVLSLLISSAKTTFDSQNGQVQHLTADIILLDHLLAQYGPETRDARDGLRRAIGPLADRIWQKNGSEPGKETPFAATAVAEDANTRIDALAPQTETQHSLKARQVVTDLTRTRLLLFEQSGKSIPIPFPAGMVFWLAIIFMSFSLFSQLNPTVIVALFVFALSASSAIFLILEMSQPFWADADFQCPAEQRARYPGTVAISRAACAHQLGGMSVAPDQCPLLCRFSDVAPGKVQGGRMMM
jgi:hypothetical protein